MDNYKLALPGHFYAVGVGPGAVDLLTLRAVRLIETADVIVAPRSEKAEESLALKTVKPYLHSQKIIDHSYPMNRNNHKTLACWQEVATRVKILSEAGKSVVQITIGEPLLYSTSCYLLGLVTELLSSDKIHVVPGISAFQAAAGIFAHPLTIQEDRMLLMTATDLQAVEAAFGHCETLVLYKAGKKISELCELLDKHKLLGQARLVCYAEQGEKQFVTHDLSQASHGKHGYMATVIINLGRRKWQQS